MRPSSVMTEVKQVMAPGTEGVRNRLIAVLERCTHGRVTAEHIIPGPDSIRRLGLDSMFMLSFLVAVEDELGIEWGDDLPREAMASLEEMAAYLARELGHAA